jgi:cobalt-zinc-cadmium efflux system protein
MAARANHEAHSHAHHGHGHDGHRHAHQAQGDDESGTERRLLAALALTVAFMGVEFVAGWMIHSLALISDAGHMLADAAALGLAVVAQRVASRPRTTFRTYGFRRAETLAALANGVALGVTGIWVVAESVARWRDPPAIDVRPMFIVTVGGLLANLLAGWVLSRGHAHNTNVRAAIAHVASDALGSAAALGAAILMWAFAWYRADVVASLAISVLILWGAFRLVTETVSVLMESAPTGVALADLESTIRGTTGVADIHDLHAWTISDGFDIVTVHVVLDGNAHGTDVARDVGERTRVAHQVNHVTVQPEAPPLPPAIHPPHLLVRRPKV